MQDQSQAPTQVELVQKGDQNGQGVTVPRAPAHRKGMNETLLDSVKSSQSMLDRDNSMKHGVFGANVSNGAIQIKKMEVLADDEDLKNKPDFDAINEIVKEDNLLSGQPGQAPD